MRTIRLFVDCQLAADSNVALPPDAARHALRVLRLRVGQPLTLYNGDGHDYQAVITRAERHQANVHVERQMAVTNESPWPITVAQCLAKGGKMDLIIQKATELGATRVVPLIGERSDVKLDGERAHKRLQHWQAIAIAATEQCGRARIPEILPPQPLSAWVSDRDDGSLPLALLPGGTSRLRDLAVPATGVTLVIGPEGGLGDQDIAALDAHGFIYLGLGPRIVRTETAALAAMAALLACHGDL